MRSGLVKARLKGISEATAETFTVLDSHIEVEEGWCEPLMARMKDHPKRVLMPQIDGVNQEVHKRISADLAHNTSKTTTGAFFIIIIIITRLLACTSIRPLSNLHPKLSRSSNLS